MSTDRRYIENETAVVNAGEQAIAAGSAHVTVCGGTVDAYDQSVIHAHARAHVIIYSDDVRVVVHAGPETITLRANETLYMPAEIRITTSNNKRGSIEHAA